MKKNKQKTKKQVSIVRWMSIANFASILGVGILLSLVCGVFIFNAISADYQNIARAASMHYAGMLEEVDPGEYHYDEATQTLYKGETVITDCAFEDIQRVDSDMHHTIFWGNKRVLTDVKDTSGQSVVGTELTDPSIINAVKNDGLYTANNVDIYGTQYSVCYYPMKNGDELVGMVFTGVNQEAANSQILKDDGIAIGISIVLAVIVSAIMVTMINKKAKVFGINLTQASDIAEDKKNSVTELGVDTKENMQQINQAIDQVAMAVTEQASHTEEIMGSMEEFASSIDIIVNHVQETSDIAGGSIELIDQLKGRLNNLEQVSEANSREIVSISEQIEEDSNAVANIGKIIDVINDIAFQITILSFNASVEAARAGEYGKGFAVVADSIKDLSDKTKDSLLGITTIVEEVNEKMEATNKASSTLISENEKVVDALAKTKEQLNDVTKAFDKIINSLNEVLEQSGAITESKDQVIETVSSLAAASEENAAMGEEMKATSDEVINATNNLIEEIERLQEVTSIIDNVKVLFADNLA